MPNKEELEFLKKQIQDVEQKLSELTSKASQIPAMVSISQSNAQKKSELYSLEMQVASHTQYLNTLKQQYAPLEVMIRELSNSNALLQANSNSLQNSIKGHQGQISELQNIFASLVQISNTYVESNGVKLDPTMVYIDAAPANYLVHTNAFTEAIKNNHKEAFDLALSKISNDDINFRDSKGKTILMYSAANAFFYAVESLLNHGATAEMYDKEGYNALFYSASLPHISCFKIILDHTKSITTPYVFAASNTVVNILINNAYKVLFSNEFEPNQYSSLNDLTPNGVLNLYGGCQTFNINTNCTIGGMNGPRPEDGYTTAEDKILRMISFIVDKDATILNIPNDQGHTPLSISCSNKIRYLANKLLDKYGSHIDKNIKDTNGVGYFTFGAHLRDITFLQKLFDQGFDINTQDKEGNSALHWMARSNYQWNDIAKWLIDHGINKDIQTNSGETALSYAAQNNNIELLNYLLAKGANHNIPTKQGIYPWHMAAYFGSLDALKILKSQVPNIEFPSDTPDKISGLYYAARQGNSLVVEWLIREGANINNKLPSNHWTPFIAACNEKKLEVAKIFLLDNKFQHDIRDGVSHNAMHWILYGGDTGTLMTILHQKNPDLIHQRNIWDETPLMWNIEKKLPIEGMKTLINLGSDINATFVKMANIQGTNQFGKLAQVINEVQYLMERTSFTFACEQHELEKAKYIMNLPNFHGSMYIDPQKFTILHWALELKDTKILHNLCTRYPALVDKADIYNKTPLAWSAEYFVTTKSAEEQNIYKHFISELISHGAQVSDKVRECAGPNVGMFEEVVRDAANDHTSLIMEYTTLGSDGLQTYA